MGLIQVLFLHIVQLKKNGIYIHATNINGKAGGNIAASTGCLLIQGGAQWNRFQSQIGKRDFKLILYRQ